MMQAILKLHVQTDKDPLVLTPILLHLSFETVNKEIEEERRRNKKIKNKVFKVRKSHC